MQKTKKILGKLGKILCTNSEQFQKKNREKFWVISWKILKIFKSYLEVIFIFSSCTLIGILKKKIMLKKFKFWNKIEIQKLTSMYIHRAIFIRFSLKFEALVAHLYPKIKIKSWELKRTKIFLRNLGKNLILKNSPILLQVSDLSLVDHRCNFFWNPKELKIPSVITHFQKAEIKNFGLINNVLVITAKF